MIAFWSVWLRDSKIEWSSSDLHFDRRRSSASKGVTLTHKRNTHVKRLLQRIQLQYLVSLNARTTCSYAWRDANWKSSDKECSRQTSEIVAITDWEIDTLVWTLHRWQSWFGMTLVIKQSINPSLAKLSVDLRAGGIGYKLKSGISCLQDKHGLLLFSMNCRITCLCVSVEFLSLRNQERKKLSIVVTN